MGQNWGGGGVGGYEWHVLCFLTIAWVGFKRNKRENRWFGGFVYLETTPAAKACSLALMKKTTH